MTTGWELRRRDSLFVSFLDSEYGWRGTHAARLVTLYSAVIITYFASQAYFPNAILQGMRQFCLLTFKPYLSGTV